MEYPKDLDECMWYIFSYPFPQGADPLEDYMLKNGKLKYIICTVIAACCFPKVIKMIIFSYSNLQSLKE